jgi:3'(2'), 5'-bisphosphate nucleotidase
VPIAVVASARGRLRMVESRSHPDERLVRLATRLADRFACVVVRSGSAGTKCARVAAGEADLYVHPVPHLREWDTCAGEAVARGAGARVSDCGGAPLQYGKIDPSHPDGIFVASPAVWESVAADVAAVASPGGESNPIR